MNTSIPTSRRAASAAALLALAITLAGCGRALPTSPEPTAPGGSRTQAGSDAAMLPDAGPDPGDAGTTPNLSGSDTQDPILSLQPGLPAFSRIAAKLVKPDRELALRAGRWLFAFHPGSMSQKKVVMVDQAIDGTLRVQLSPGSLAFGTAVDLTVDYSGTRMDPASAGYVPGTHPVFCSYEPLTKRWVVAMATDDPAQKCVHVQLRRLGIYGLRNSIGW